MLIADSLANQQFTNFEICESLKSRLMPKFVLYYFDVIDEWCKLHTNVSSFPSVDMEALKQLPFPVPPLAVQREIVHILDCFTLLEAELEAELEAREKQYTYYRDELLNFNQALGYKSKLPYINNLIARLCPEGVEHKELKDVILSLNTGLNPRRFFKLNTDDAKNYYVTIREIRNNKITFTDKTDRINDEALRLCNNRSNLEKGDVLFSGTGTIGEVVVIKDTPNNWNIKEGVYSIKPNSLHVDSSFLGYLLQSTKIRQKYIKKTQGGTVRSVSMVDLRSLKIPVPPLEIQRRIVAILDRFDALCNDIAIGLPAEIKARKKQYEYYRDQLLSFNK